MIEIFGTGWGNYAIRGIVEPVLPEPVSLLPRTPGWWLLLILLAGMVARFAWRRYRRYRRNAYRRQARDELATLAQRLEAGDRSAARELAPLLRATALAAGERRELASPQGAAWIEALSSLAPDSAPLPVEDLEALAYAPEDQTQAIDVLDAARRLGDWIETHGEARA